MRLARIRSSAVLAAVSAAAVLTACGSSSSTGGASTATSASATSGTSSATSALTSATSTATAAASDGFAQAAVSKGYASTDATPPSAGPKAQKGKSVWYISCGQLAIGCSAPAAAAQAAAQKIGWKFTLYDGAFDAADKYNTGILQAVAAKANGIILGGVDCSAVKASLQKAKAAGIKVVAFEAFDCDDPSVGGPTLFSTTAHLSPTAPTWADFIRQWGAIKADWIIAKTKGAAKVIELKHEGHLLGDYMHQGFDAELKKCGGCKILSTVPILDADLTSPGLASKTSAAILASPTANAIEAPYDSFITLGVANALARSGKASQISVIGGEGYPANMDAIRANKGQTAAAAWSVAWAEWSLVDTLNRLFAGQTPAVAGVGFTLVDTDHNLTAAGQGFASKIDFKAAYAKIWGV